MCVYVCICIYIHIHIYTYTYMHTYIYSTRTCINMYVRECVFCFKGM